MLQAAEEEVPGGAEGSNKRRKTLPNMLEDNRFKAMFEDPSFAVDETADDYKFHHPNAGECFRGAELLVHWRCYLYAQYMWEDNCFKAMFEELAFAVFCEQLASTISSS